MSNKIKLPKANKGYGYVGVWAGPDPKLGWFVAPHVYGGKSDRNYPSIADNPNMKGERFFLCEITIKPLKDKKGRPITKIVK
jgi:hypothetical protein